MFDRTRYFFYDYSKMEVRSGGMDEDFPGVGLEPQVHDSYPREGLGLVFNSEFTNFRNGGIPAGAADAQCSSISSCFACVRSACSWSLLRGSCEICPFMQVYEGACIPSGGVERCPGGEKKEKAGRLNGQKGQISAGRDAQGGSLHNSCQHTLVLRDSEGNGWSGGSVSVRAGREWLVRAATLRKQDGGEASIPLPVTSSHSGLHLDVVYRAGDDAHENSFAILDFRRRLVYENSPMQSRRAVTSGTRAGHLFFVLLCQLTRSKHVFLCMCSPSSDSLPVFCVYTMC